MKKLLFLLMLLVIAMLFTLEANSKEENPICLMKASLGNDFKLNEILFKGIKSEKPNFQTSDKFTHVVIIDAKQWKKDLIKKDSFSRLTIERSTDVSETKERNNHFVIISANSENKLNSPRKRETQISLTSFSLKGESYKLIIGSSNAFSWDDEGLTSIEASSFFSDNNSKYGSSMVLFKGEKRRSPTSNNVYF